MNNQSDPFIDEPDPAGQTSNLEAGSAFASESGLSPVEPTGLAASNAVPASDSQAGDAPSENAATGNNQRWADLARLLGLAELPPEPVSSEPVIMVEEPTSAVVSALEAAPSKKEAKRPEPQRTETRVNRQWRDLANEFGLEPPPPIEEVLVLPAETEETQEKPESGDVPEQTATSRRAETGPTRQASPTPVRELDLFGTASSFGQSSSAESTFASTLPPAESAAAEDDPLLLPRQEFVDEVVQEFAQIELEGTEGAPEGEVTAESESESGRRRRRRRRGRRGARRDESTVVGGSEGAAESAASEDEGEEERPARPVKSADWAEVAREDEDETRDEDQGLEESESTVSGEPVPPRGRRRRRRRSGERAVEASPRDTSPRDTSPREAEPERRKEPVARAEPELSVEPPRGYEAIPASHDAHDDDDLSEGDFDEGDDEGGMGKHRKIPTWAEAIEIIVTTNMANRPKNSGPYRGRGRSRRPDRS